METHWPSLQVKDPEPQEVTFTRVFLEFDLAVQGSSVTVEKSKSCNPSNIEISDEVLEQDFLLILISFVLNCTSQLHFDCLSGQTTAKLACLNWTRCCWSICRGITSSRHGPEWRGTRCRTLTPGTVLLHWWYLPGHSVCTEDSTEWSWAHLSATSSDSWCDSAAGRRLTSRTPPSDCCTSPRHCTACWLPRAGARERWRWQMTTN